MVRRRYEAFARGDLDAAFDRLGPDFEWLPPGESLTAGTYRGAEAVKAEVATWTEPFEDFRWEATEIIGAGDQVLVAGRMSGRGKGSGAGARVDEYHVWNFEGDRPLRVRMYRERGEALAAAGIEAGKGPEENIRIVRRGYEAFNRGDTAAALGDLDRDIEWRTYVVPGPGGGTYRGHDGVKELWGDARNIFGDFRNDPELLFACGDRVVSFVSVRGRGKGSGVQVQARIAHLIILRGGKIVRIQSFEDRDEALSALAGTESPADAGTPGRLAQ
jgi:uncharacterized protein